MTTNLINLLERWNRLFVTDHVVCLCAEDECDACRLSQDTDNELDAVADTIRTKDKAIALLNSMVNGGESHSDQSRALAQAALGEEAKPCPTQKTK